MSHNDNHSYLNWTRYIIARRAGQIPAPLGHTPYFMRRETVSQTTSSLATRIALTGNPFAADLGVPTPPSQPAAPEGRGVLAEIFADRMRRGMLTEIITVQMRHRVPSTPSSAPSLTMEDPDATVPEILTVEDIEAMWDESEFFIMLGPDDWAGAEDVGDIERAPWPNVRIIRLHDPDDADSFMEDEFFVIHLPAVHVTTTDVPDTQPPRRSSLDSIVTEPDDMDEPEDGQNRRRVAAAAVFGDVRELVRAHADADGNPVLLDLTCMICNVRPLEVPEAVAPRRPGYQRYGPEAFIVLPCGHFFGDRCYARWHNINVEQHSRPHCPMCRFVMTYNTCNHDIPVVLANAESVVPRTIAEGGTVPDNCCECDPDRPEGSW
ncbi:hypothetical protein GGR53DRAFT_528596 [Hypoxylon sp. FL1150]|nr:hypothetical protein GGR53DRAFT_528596 [Hypoxylon sp. FL1150]